MCVCVCVYTCNTHKETCSHYNMLQFMRNVNIPLKAHYRVTSIKPNRLMYIFYKNRQNQLHSNCD